MDQIYGLDFIVQVHTIDDDSMDTFQIEYIYLGFYDYLSFDLFMLLLATCLKK